MSAPSPDPAAQRVVADVEEQERRLVLSAFDEDDAWELGSSLVRLARERGLSVTVDVRRGAHQLFHAALPGTAADNDVWIARKVAVVERYGASSYLVGRRLAARGDVLGPDHGVDPVGYATHGGAFPVRVRGVGVVAVVTVSGLPQADDHALVVEALEQLLAAQGR